MTLTREQEYSLDLFKEGKSLLITGEGGVGKTHLKHELKKDAELRGKKVLLCDLTRVLGERKQTKKHLKGVNILIIDEIFTLSNKLFEVLGDLSRITRLNTEPGELQVILTGCITDSDDWKEALHTLSFTHINLTYQFNTIIIT